MYESVVFSHHTVAVAGVPFVVDGLDAQGNPQTESITISVPPADQEAVKRRARRIFRRRMKRLEKRAEAMGIPTAVLHQARVRDADPKRCNIAFARWAQEERRAVGEKWRKERRRGWRPRAPWLTPREETGQVHRRRAHLYERAAHLVARLHQEIE